VPVAEGASTVEESGLPFDAGSFRDRSGRVVVLEDRVLRALNSRALDDWKRVSGAPFFAREMQERRIVHTQEVSPPPALATATHWAGWLEHERIPFVSYPYEWSFGMLRQAALLQLDLMAAALGEGFILKDATPYNVQFRGAAPVFIDTPSFVPHDGGPWEGYRQFCQAFLYPLMLQAWRGVDFQPWLRGRLDGLTPREFSRLLSIRDFARRGALSHVYLHSKLSDRPSGGADNLPQSLQASGFNRELITANVSKLRRLVEGLRWRDRRSYWSHYDVDSDPVRLDGAAKEAFVSTVTARRRWTSVWDLGCNVGRYSRIAAEHADQVLACDVDHLAVDRLYAAVREEGRRNILPLVYNIADPSPGLGWRGRERSPLEDRGRPDLVLCLALIHHLVLRENLLLPEVVEWLAGLGGSLVIEFVDKTDPQARSLLANRADQYDDYSQPQFEQLLERHFIVRERRPLPSGTRTIYFAERR
jgi:SAM-dependent methyltransferase